MLLTLAELLELRRDLAERLNTRRSETGELLWSCDHTLTHTRAWLRAHKKPLRANLSAIKERGGHCDCEVLLNVTVKRWPTQANGQRRAA